MILNLANITTEFKLHKNSYAKAVNGVNLTIAKNEILGIVGESGSGKTVLTHSIMGLHSKSTTRISGKAIFDGIDLLSIHEKQLRSIRGNTLSMIFQDPSSSLNPYLQIGKQLIEPLLLHKKISRSDALSMAISMLSEVGIDKSNERIFHYPYQLSGGMRQRAMIAMALLTKPKLLIADEPTTALDVTVQAQILKLLKNLQAQYGMSIIFISHNLAVIAQFCSRAAVMYGGKIMEIAPVDKLFSKTSHPYTYALIKSIPSLDITDRKLFSIEGMPPSPLASTPGCPFAPRCIYANDDCFRVSIEPTFIESDHATACTRLCKGEITLD